jgi:hypothetical protein
MLYQRRGSCDSSRRNLVWLEARVRVCCTPRA